MFISADYWLSVMVLNANTMTQNKIIRENPMESFICASCGKAISPLAIGGNQRNHCPHCLCSLHVDIIPGDRRSSCRGIMKPIGIHVQKNKEWSIIHQCTKCNTIKLNRIAADDNELLLLTMAAEPLMSLPFPAKGMISTLQRLSMEKGGEMYELEDTEFPPGPQGGIEDTETFLLNNKGVQTSSLNQRK